MPTDPFVAPALGDAPRNEPNLAPGVHLPAARAWRADRPGDLVGASPTGTFLGRPGPNVGFALTLAHRASSRIALAPHEASDDALSVVAGVAMRRAAAYGRGPTAGDVEVALSLLGYCGDVAPDFAAWRAAAVHGAHHEYGPRRRLVDAVPEVALRTPPADPAAVVAVRESVRAAFAAA